MGSGVLRYLSAGHGLLVQQIRQVQFDGNSHNLSERGAIDHPEQCFLRLGRTRR
jgi:hypothetical protein